MELKTINELCQGITNEQGKLKYISADKDNIEEFISCYGFVLTKFLSISVPQTSFIENENGSKVIRYTKIRKIEEETYELQIIKENITDDSNISFGIILHSPFYINQISKKVNYLNTRYRGLKNYQELFKELVTNLSYYTIWRKIIERLKFTSCTILLDWLKKYFSCLINKLTENTIFKREEIAEFIYTEGHVFVSMNYGFLESFDLKFKKIFMEKFDDIFFSYFPIIAGIEEFEDDKNKENYTFSALQTILQNIYVIAEEYEITKGLIDTKIPAINFFTPISEKEIFNERLFMYSDVELEQIVEKIRKIILGFIKENINLEYRREKNFSEEICRDYNKKEFLDFLSNYAIDNFMIASMK